MNDVIIDLCIVGAGPAGIEAALQADARGMSYVLLDKDIAGSLIERTMAEKRFFHSYGRNSKAHDGLLAFPDHALGRELVAAWHTQLEGRAFKQECEVRAISREGDVFTVETGSERYRARRVLLASGTLDVPRTLGVPGERENRGRIAYQFEYGHDHGEGPFIVVGGGNSALEAAIELTTDGDVTLVVRKDHFTESATEANKEELADLVAEGRVRVLWNSVIEEVRDGEVVVRAGGVRETLPLRKLFIHIGYHTPTAFLAACGVALEGGVPIFNESFETAVPGLFIAGSLTGADSIVESADQARHVIEVLEKGV